MRQAAVLRSTLKATRYQSTTYTLGYDQLLAARRRQYET
jgi:hypothetical protein